MAGAGGPTSPRSPDPKTHGHAQLAPVCCHQGAQRASMSDTAPLPPGQKVPCVLLQHCQVEWKALSPGHLAQGQGPSPREQGEPLPPASGEAPVWLVGPVLGWWGGTMGSQFLDLAVASIRVCARVYGIRGQDTLGVLWYQEDGGVNKSGHLSESEAAQGECGPARGEPPPGHCQEMLVWGVVAGGALPYPPLPPCHPRGGARILPQKLGSLRAREAEPGTPPGDR